MCLSVPTTIYQSWYAILRCNRIPITMTFPTVYIKRYKMRLLIATVASTSALAITIVQGHIGRRPASRPCVGAMTGHFRVLPRLMSSIRRKLRLYIFLTWLLFKFVDQANLDQAPIRNTISQDLKKITISA